MLINTCCGDRKPWSLYRPKVTELLFLINWNSPWKFPCWKMATFKSTAVSWVIWPLPHRFLNAAFFWSEIFVRSLFLHREWPIMSRMQGLMGSCHIYHVVRRAGRETLDVVTDDIRPLKDCCLSRYRYRAGVWVCCKLWSLFLDLSHVACCCWRITLL